MVRVGGCREDGFVPLSAFVDLVAKVTPTDLAVEGKALDAKKASTKKGPADTF